MSIDECVVQLRFDVENPGVQLFSNGNHENFKFEAKDLFNILSSKENPG